MRGTAAYGLKAPGGVLLVSTYELGHQPQGIAMPQAFLERAGYRPSVLDLAVESLDADKVRAARFVAVSVPMHTALRLGLRAARRIRELNRECHVCFHGHYAQLHGATLLRTVADSVLGGEAEQRLVELANALGNGALTEALTETMRAPALAKLDFPTPSRSTLPRLERYAHLEHADQHRIAGYTEASRGCLHHCRHCPLPAVYGGRFFVVPRDVVLADIRNQVAAGATHVTFGDADFLNGPGHSLRIARAVHDEFPELTFDFTAKVQHVRAQRRIMAELRELGAIFVVTAVECLNDRILALLDKGHTRADVVEAQAILSHAGIAMRPSLLPFTPWSDLRDFIDILDFVEREDLVDHVDPVQYSIRLLLPPGSLLLRRTELQPFLGSLDEEQLTYRWRHRDPVMDRLQRSVAQLVEESVRQREDPMLTFDRIRVLAGLTSAPRTRRPERPPRLTESWFC